MWFKPRSAGVSDVLTALRRLEALHGAGGSFPAGVEGRHVQTVDAVRVQVGNLPAGSAGAEALGPLLTVMRVVSV